MTDASIGSDADATLAPQVDATDAIDATDATGVMDAGYVDPTCALAEICEGTHYARTQAAVDGLHRCREVTGELMIGGTGGQADPIVDLERLSCLERVGDRLWVGFAPGITTLRGLRHVREVGQLELEELQHVETLAGLASLRVAREHFSVHGGNYFLGDLSALERVELRGRLSFTVSNIEEPHSVSECALDALWAAVVANGAHPSWLVVSQGVPCVTPNVCAGRTCVGPTAPKQYAAPPPDAACASARRCEGRVWVQTQSELNALAGCWSFAGDLNIVTNPGTDPVVDLGPLSCLVRVGGILQILGHEAVDLAPLANLRRVGKLVLDMPSLTSLSGLEGLRQVDSQVSLGADSLTDLTPLGSARLFRGRFDLGHASLLSECAAQALADALELDGTPEPITRNIQGAIPCIAPASCHGAICN